MIRAETPSTVISTEPAREGIAERVTVEDEDATIYADPEGETVPHEGPLCLLVSGGIQLPTGRLLSPSAVHHVDPA